MVLAQEYSWNELGPTMEIREKDLVHNHAVGQDISFRKLGRSMLIVDQGVATFLFFYFSGHSPQSLGE